MSPRKATENLEEATVETSTEDLTLEQLKAQLAEQSKKIEQLEGKQEGWLITVNDPAYDGVTEGISFTSGLAWLPKDKVLPQFVRLMPNETEIQKEANERNKFDHHTTLEDVRAEFANTVKMSSVEFAVKKLTNDFGYKARYFSKNEMAELDQIRKQREVERAEAISKKKTRKDYIERLEREHGI